MRYEPPYHLVLCVLSVNHSKPPHEMNLVKATQPFERLHIDFKGPLPSASTNKFILTVTDEYSRFPFAVPCKDVKTESVVVSLTSIFSLFGLPGYVHSDRGSSFLSDDLKQWLHTKGVPTSRTTPYNPQGNGQCERYNGIIWTTIQHLCKSRNIDIKHWETVLPDALHAIRSLLCTATNATPHERMFNHLRRSASGQSLPSWLTPGPVYLKQHVRKSKYDKLVKKVELLEANPNYAHIRHEDGRETTVSLRDIAPYVEDSNENNPHTETNLVYEDGALGVQDAPTTEEDGIAQGAEGASTTDDSAICNNEQEIVHSPNNTEAVGSALMFGDLPTKDVDFVGDFPGFVGRSSRMSNQPCRFPEEEKKLSTVQQGIFTIRTNWLQEKVQTK